MPDAENALKRSAQRRLIGAIALALVTVVVLPMIFDTEPPPLSDDVEIVVPSRDLPVPVGVSDVKPSPAAVASLPVAVSSPTVVSPASASAPAPARQAPAPALAPTPVHQALDAAKGAQSAPTFLQLGVFSNQSGAQSLAQRVGGAGFTVNVVEDDGRYKVRCGPFSAKAAAQTMQGALRAKGFNAVVVNP